MKPIVLRIDTSAQIHCFAKESLDSIGGLDVLKSWLVRRKHAFSQKAWDYGLPTPKGLLIMGIPGTGKSLTAKSMDEIGRTTIWCSWRRQPTA